MLAYLVFSVLTARAQIISKKIDNGSHELPQALTAHPCPLSNIPHMSSLQAYCMFILLYSAKHETLLTEKI
jgi:hypothetical protein